MSCRFVLFLFLVALPLQGCAGKIINTGPEAVPEVAMESTPVQVATTASKPLPELFKQVSPSVVVIQTVEKKITSKLKKGKAEVENAYGLGSGVLISNDGKVLTAAHVVHSADVVAVKLQNNEQIAAKVIGSSPDADVALLQLEKVPEGFNPAVLGDSDLVQVGEAVMVIGAPYGISKTMTVGYISGRITPKDKLIGSQQMELFQSDAAVNSGNSGGPMFNMQGEIVGIVSSILSRSGGFEGISFAVTTNTAKKLLIDQPSYWLGLDAAILSEVMAKIFNVPGGSGVLIQRVAENSLGDRLGLKPGYLPISIANQEFIAGGDIIIEVLGSPVPNNPDELPIYFEGLRKKFREMKPSDSFSVKALRDGNIVDLQTTVE